MASKKEPLVMDVKGNSLDDGPGTRSVVFFKGCPLDCFWCQNPESKSAEPELLFDKQKCVQALVCVDACPEGALSKGEPLEIDREKCTLCFKCTEECPSTALEKVGTKMSVDEIVAKVVPYKSFFDTSGGGVTLSGGEPVLFMEFASELLKRLKEEGIHTLVETSGFFDFDRFEKLILPYTDLIYMDIKIVNTQEHKKWCGVDNSKILDNFVRLHKLSQKGGFTIKPRTPLIPGVNDSDEKMKDLAEFYEKNGVKTAALMKNNPIWFEKFEKMGVETDIAKDDPMRGFYDNERYASIKKIFEEKGIEILES